MEDRKAACFAVPDPIRDLFLRRRGSRIKSGTLPPPTSLVCDPARMSGALRAAAHRRATPKARRLANAPRNTDGGGTRLA